MKLYNLQAVLFAKQNLNGESRTVLKNGTLEQDVSSLDIQEQENVQKYLTLFDVWKNAKINLAEAKKNGADDQECKELSEKEAAASKDLTLFVRQNKLSKLIVKLGAQWQGTVEEIQTFLAENEGSNAFKETLSFVGEPTDVSVDAENLLITGKGLKAVEEVRELMEDKLEGLETFLVSKRKAKSLYKKYGIVLPTIEIAKAEPEKTAEILNVLNNNKASVKTLNWEKLEKAVVSERVYKQTIEKLTPLVEVANSGSAELKILYYKLYRLRAQQGETSNKFSLKINADAIESLEEQIELVSQKTKNAVQKINQIVAKVAPELLEKANTAAEFQKFIKQTILPLAQDVESKRKTPAETLEAIGDIQEVLTTFQSEIFYFDFKNVVSEIAMSVNGGNKSYREAMVEITQIAQSSRFTRSEMKTIINESDFIPLMSEHVGIQDLQTYATPQQHVQAEVDAIFSNAPQALGVKNSLAIREEMKMTKLFEGIDQAIKQVEKLAKEAMTQTNAESNKGENGWGGVSAIKVASCLLVASLAAVAYTTPSSAEEHDTNSIDGDFSPDSVDDTLGQVLSGKQVPSSVAEFTLLKNENGPQISLSASESGGSASLKSDGFLASVGLSKDMFSSEVQKEWGARDWLFEVSTGALYKLKELGDNELALEGAASLTKLFAYMEATDDYKAGFKASGLIDSDNVQRGNLTVGGFLPNDLGEMRVTYQILQKLIQEKFELSGSVEDDFVQHSVAVDFVKHFTGIVKELGLQFGYHKVDGKTFYQGIYEEDNTTHYQLNEQWAGLGGFEKWGADLKLVFGKNFDSEKFVKGIKLELTAGVERIDYEAILDQAGRSETDPTLGAGFTFRTDACDLKISGKGSKATRRGGEIRLSDPSGEFSVYAAGTNYATGQQDSGEVAFEYRKGVSIEDPSDLLPWNWVKMFKGKGKKTQRPKLIPDQKPDGYKYVGDFGGHVIETKTFEAALTPREQLRRVIDLIREALDAGVTLDKADLTLTVDAVPSLTAIKNVKSSVIDATPAFSLSGDNLIIEIGDLPAVDQTIWIILQEAGGALTLVKVVTEKGSVIVKSVDFMSGYANQGDVDDVINGVTDINKVPLAATDFSYGASIDGSAKTFDWRALSGAVAGDTIVLKTDGSKGAYTISGDNMTFTPDANQAGSDSGVFTISNASGSKKDITVTVNGIDTVESPAIDFTYGTSIVNSAKTFDWRVLSGADAGDTIALKTDGSKGSYTISGDNMTFTPSVNQSGSDVGVFTVTDSVGNSKDITVTVNGIDTADSPASSFTYGTNIGSTAKTFDWRVLSGADSGDTIVLKTDGSKGSYTISGDNMTFTPSVNQSGSDVGVFTVTDSVGNSKDITVTVNGISTVPAVDAPASWSGSFSSSIDRDSGTGGVQLYAGDSPTYTIPAVSDADGVQSRTCTIDGQPGTLTIAGNNVTIPNTLPTGTYTLRVAGAGVDGGTGSNSSLSDQTTTFEVVNVPNSAPTINTPTSSATVTVGDPNVSLSAILADADVGDSNTYSIAIESGAGSLTGDTGGNFTNNYTSNFEFVIPGSAGTTVIKVTSSDGDVTTTKDITITIIAAPPPPPC